MECRTAVTLFFQAEDGIRDKLVTGVQTCALPISRAGAQSCGGPPAQRSFPEGGGRAEQGEGRPGEPGRSEERRVGKGVDLGGRRIIKKKKRTRAKASICAADCSRAPRDSATPLPV